MTSPRKAESSTAFFKDARENKSQEIKLSVTPLQWLPSGTIPAELKDRSPEELIAKMQERIKETVEHIDQLLTANPTDMLVTSEMFLTEVVDWNFENMPEYPIDSVCGPGTSQKLETELRQKIIDVCIKHHTAAILGGRDFNALDGNGLPANKAEVIAEDGTTIHIYHKQNLVADETRQVSKGPNSDGNFTYHGISMGVLTCFDIDDAAIVDKLFAGGKSPVFVANPSCVPHGGVPKKLPAEGSKYYNDLKKTEDYSMGFFVETLKAVTDRGVYVLRTDEPSQTAKGSTMLLGPNGKIGGAEFPYREFEQKLSITLPTAKLELAATRETPSLVERKPKPIQEVKTMLPISRDEKASELKKQQVVDQINEFSAILAAFKRDVDEYDIPTNAQKRLNKFIAEIEPLLKNTSDSVTAQQQENKAYLAEQLFKLTDIIQKFDKRIRDEIFPLEKKGDKRTNDVGFLGGHGSENTLFDILTKTRDALNAMRVKRQHAVDKSKLTTEVKIASQEIHEEETKDTKSKTPNIADEEARKVLYKKLTDFDSDVVRQFYKELVDCKCSRDKKENLILFATEIIQLNLPSYDRLNSRQDVSMAGFESSLHQNITVFETRIKNEMATLEHNTNRSDDDNALLTVLRNAKTAIDKMTKQVAHPIIFPEIPRTEVKAVPPKQADESDGLLQELKLLISRLDALSSDLGKYNGENKKIKQDLSEKTIKWLSECKKVNETFVTSKTDYDRNRGNPLAVVDYQTQLAELKKTIETTKAAFDDLLSHSKAKKIGIIGRKPLAVADPALHGIIADAEVTSARSVRAAMEIGGPRKGK